MTEQELNNLMARRGVAPDGSRIVPTDPTQTPHAQSGPANPPAARDPLAAFLPDPTPDPTPAPTPAPAPGAATPTPAAPAVDPVMAQMQNDLAAANGRVGPMQMQLEQQRLFIQTMQQNQQQLQQQLAAALGQQSVAKAQQLFADFNPFEGLSEQQLAALDPEAADIIKAANRNAMTQLAAHVENRFSELDQRRQTEHQTEIQTLLTRKGEELGLNKLSTDPAFKKFLDEDDSAKYLLGMFVNAKSTGDVHTLTNQVKGMIKRYEKTTAAPSAPSPDPATTTTTTNFLDRNFNGTAQAHDPKKVKEVLAEAKRLSRAGMHKEAAALSATVQ